ncbi:hypothetical protein [Alicyclobacillus sp. ALC3]|uniref:hypothetical protein n=1 Tax=Alicyclobacillus sp. ALC3 TaxID=2796143 RepID=UPI002378A235|nr:hypothetical protein [Alicyclobacillus sp. ALC3]WDL96380.1 hypothetical protein JC200_18950 [Alicyclobacillus sp. ALC3]
MNVRDFTDLVQLMLSRADKAIEAGDAEAAHEAIEHARVQLKHTVRELEREGAIRHDAV